MIAFIYKFRKRIGCLFLVLTPCCLCCGWLIRFADGMCGSDIQDTLLSPDGRLRVYRFKSSCGAIDSFTYEMVVLPAEEAFDRQHGNVYSSHTEMADGYEWIGPRTLYIHSPFPNDKFLDGGYAVRSVDASTGWFRHETVKVSYRD